MNAPNDHVHEWQAHGLVRRRSEGESAMTLGGHHHERGDDQ